MLCENGSREEKIISTTNPWSCQLEKTQVTEANIHLQIKKICLRTQIARKSFTDRSDGLKSNELSQRHVSKSIIQAFGILNKRAFPIMVAPASAYRWFGSVSYWNRGRSWAPRIRKKRVTYELPVFAEGGGFTLSNWWLSPSI